jgi:hypothetical protein
MWDFKLGAAFGAMQRTLPFLLARMLVYFGIALLYVFSTGVGGALGYGFTRFGDGEGEGAVVGAFIGFAGASGLLYWVREYILYLVKAGHIAVLVRIYDQQPLPGGRGQIDYASSIVKERFKDASLLFALDQLIKGVLAALIGVLRGLMSILPLPGLNAVVGVLTGILRLSLTYVDEMMLAKIIRDESDNPWETARHALVLYAQNYKRMLKNAVWLWVLMWVLTLAIFVVMIGPAFALMALVPGDLGFWAFVIAFILAWSVKMALIESLALFAYLQVYFQGIEGQTPDPVWDQRLCDASHKFRQLKERALNPSLG